MGRKSKLTPDQWAEIEKRLLDGEGVRALAAEFKVSPTAISKSKSKQVEEVKAVANQIVETESRLQRLPVTSQIFAQSYAAKLRSVQGTMLAVAENGAKTALRLTSLANEQVQKIDDAAPLGNAETLKGITVLCEMANRAAFVPMGLMAANKESVKLNDEPIDITPDQIPADPMEASRAYMRLMNGR